MGKLYTLLDLNDGKVFPATISMLLATRDVMCDVAAADTAYDADSYTEGLVGHCGAVAFVTQFLFGGLQVSGKVNGERHIWNKLNDGTNIDLTSPTLLLATEGVAYGGISIPTYPEELRKRHAQILPERQTVNPRFELFASRFVDAATESRLFDLLLSASV